MRIFKHYIFILLLANVASCSGGEENTFKKSVLDGYHKRCTEVLTKKGFEPKTVELECNCEVTHVSENFDTFQLMISSAKASLGKDPVSKEKVEKMKKKIASCKKQFLNDG